MARKNLAAAWTWGKKYYGLPSGNSFAEVERFPADQNPRYVPPEADFWKVHDVADPDDQVLLLFLLHTGARIGEAFRLLWTDVDLPGRKVRLGTRKSGHGGMEYAWLPLAEALYRALAGLHLRSRSRHVFVCPHTGRPYTARTKYMKMLCQKAHVRHFGFHAIRHLSATILAYGGLDIPSIQAVLRHKSPQTTARYIKNLGVCVDQLDRVFSKSREGTKVLPFMPSQKAIGT